MIVSFHSKVKGDVNLKVASKRHFSPQEVAAAKHARAIVVPQSFTRFQYNFIKTTCEHVFPNYTYRFGYEGKCGNTNLFRKFNSPHPKTYLYDSVETFRNRHNCEPPPLSFPFVLKGDAGGGGWAVFLIRNFSDLEKGFKVLDDQRFHPQRKFVIQEFIPHKGRDLRVVVIGSEIQAYWRCQPDPNEFRNNVGRGAVIRHDIDPGSKQRGISCVTDFCLRAGINLAAFDVIFDFSSPDPKPLLSEINFIFGRKGLGGSLRFYELLNYEVKRWARILGPMTSR